MRTPRGILHYAMGDYVEEEERYRERGGERERVCVWERGEEEKRRVCDRERKREGEGKREIMSDVVRRMCMMSYPEMNCGYEMIGSM